MSLKRSLSALQLVVMLAACSAEPSGSEFIGKWQHTKKNFFGETVTHIIEFAKNGDSLLLIDGSQKYPATINKDKTVQVSAPTVGTIVFSYSKASDTVIGLGDEFSRVK